MPLRFTGQMGDMFYSAESCMGITKLKADTIWILSLFKDLPSNSRNSVGMCIHPRVSACVHKNNFKARRRDNVGYNMTSLHPDTTQLNSLSIIAKITKQ